MIDNVNKNGESFYILTLLNRISDIAHWFSKFHGNISKLVAKFLNYSGFTAARNGRWWPW